MEVFYLVLEFEKKKWTFTKIEGGNLDFFQSGSIAYLPMYRLPAKVEGRHQESGSGRLAAG